MAVQRRGHCRRGGCGGCALPVPVRFWTSRRLSVDTRHLLRRGARSPRRTGFAVAAQRRARGGASSSGTTASITSGPGRPAEALTRFYWPAAVLAKSRTAAEVRRNRRAARLPSRPSNTARIAAATSGPTESTVSLSASPGSSGKGVGDDHLPRDASESRRTGGVGEDRDGGGDPRRPRRRASTGLGGVADGATGVDCVVGHDAHPPDTSPTTRLATEILGREVSWSCG